MTIEDKAIELMTEYPRMIQIGNLIESCKRDNLDSNLVFRKMVEISQFEENLI